MWELVLLPKDQTPIVAIFTDADEALQQFFRAQVAAKLQVASYTMSPETKALASQGKPHAVTIRPMPLESLAKDASPDLKSAE